MSIDSREYIKHILPQVCITYGSWFVLNITSTLFWSELGLSRTLLAWLTFDTRELKINFGGQLLSVQTYLFKPSRYIVNGDRHLVQQCMFV